MPKFTDISFTHNIPIMKVAQHFDVEEMRNSPAPMNFSTKYCGTMQFVITFYANKANYHSAVENAERMVYRELNSKALIELDKLKTIAYKYIDPELEAAINQVIHLVDGGN